MLFQAFKRVSTKELVYVVLCFLVVNFFVGITQPRLRVHGGRGWDGEVYIGMAQQIALGQRPAQPAPFIDQPGTCLLVGLLHPQDWVAGFLWVNIAAGLMMVVLLAFWLGLWVEDWKLRLALNLSFQTTAVGPICFVWFYPALTDHWPTVFILAALLWMVLVPSLPKAAWGVAALCFIGIFFREVLFAVPLGFLFRGWRWDEPIRSLREDLPWKLLPLVATLAGWSLLHLWVLDTGTLQWGYWREAWELLRHHSPARWVLTWFGAFGPLVFAVLLRPAQAFLPFRGRPELLAFLGAVIGLTVLSSGEERYFFWLCPVLYGMAGSALAAEGILFRHWGMGALLVLAQGVSQRIFWIASPDWPRDSTPGLPVVLSPIGSNVNYFDLIAVSEKPDVALARLLQYLGLGLFLLLAQRWQDRKFPWGKARAGAS